MPRIAAPTIAEHVRNQTGRVLDAAGRLFRERGLYGTDMGAIATAVGLARNSLYRYYPDKAHLFIACMRHDMEPVLGRVRALEDTHPEARVRIDAWIDTLIDAAGSPAHATMGMISEIRTGAPELRQQLLQLHQAPNDVLERAVRTVLAGTRRDPVPVATMIAGMVHQGAGRVIRRGSRIAVKRELKSAVARLLGS